MVDAAVIPGCRALTALKIGPAFPLIVVFNTFPFYTPVDLTT